MNPTISIVIHRLPWPIWRECGFTATPTLPLPLPLPLPSKALLTPAHSRYADHVGIHYVLCSKLRTFAYEELEFFLPQYVPSAHPARPRCRTSLPSRRHIGYVTSSSA